AVEPDSLREAVAWAHEVSGVPVLVTEHGISTPDDRIRVGFLRSSLESLATSVAGGLPVLGYCHWTLLDGYEWIFGYEPKL
ncbi:family 1 glycosylhydrolase, partial [Acinetobacter baumannii]